MAQKSFISVQTSENKPTHNVNLAEQRQHAGLAESGTQSALSVTFSWGNSWFLSPACWSLNGAGAKSNSCREEALGATAFANPACSSVESMARDGYSDDISLVDG